MKSFSILILILAFVNLKSDSQSNDSLINAYNTKTIYRFGTRFMKGNDKLTFHDLKAQFNSPITMNLYYKSKNRSTISKVCNLASLTLVIVSAFTPTNTAGNIKFIAGTSILGLGGLYYHDLSSKFLDKAIWIHNKEALFNNH